MFVLNGEDTFIQKKLWGDISVNLSDIFFLFFLPCAISLGAVAGLTVWCGRGKCCCKGATTLGGAAVGGGFGVPTTGLTVAPASDRRPGTFPVRCTGSLVFGFTWEYNYFIRQQVWWY